MALVLRSWAWNTPHVAFHDTYEEISASFFTTYFIDPSPQTVFLAVSS